MKILFAFLLLSASPLNAGQLENGSFSAELNGQKVAYQVSGMGEPLLVLTNTWGLEKEPLLALFAGLTQHFTLVCFDLPGMGDSSPTDDPTSFGIEGARQTLKNLAAHLGLDKYYLLGWSAGAMNGLLYAQENAAQLKGAIFVHGISYVDPAEAQKFSSGHEAFFLRRSEMMKELLQSQESEAIHNEKLKRFIVDEWFPYICADRKAGVELIKKYFDSGTYSWKHMRQMFNDLGDFDARETLPKITCPVLVISGSKDLLPPEIVARDAKAMPNASVVNFEKSGHFSMIEEPDAFLDAILVWQKVNP